MLTAVELREQSRIYREAARSVADDATRRRLATCALALAQIAEAVEGEGRFEEFFKSTKLDRLLAQVDESVRQTIKTLLRERQADPVTTDRIRRWRMRAEELRMTADGFAIPSAQQTLRRAAANYDNLADEAETRLAGGQTLRDKAE